MIIPSEFKKGLNDYKTIFDVHPAEMKEDGVSFQRELAKTLVAMASPEAEMLPIYLNKHEEQITELVDGASLLPAFFLWAQVLETFFLSNTSERRSRLELAVTPNARFLPKHGLIKESSSYNDNYGDELWHLSAWAEFCPRNVKLEVKTSGAPLS